MFVIYPVLVMIDKPRGMIATASFGICQPLLRRTEATVSPARDGGVVRRQPYLPIPVASFRNVTETLAPGSPDQR